MELMRVRATVRLRQRTWSTTQVTSHRIIADVVTPESGPVGFAKVKKDLRAAELSPAMDARAGEQIKSAKAHAVNQGPETAGSDFHFSSPFSVRSSQLQAQRCQPGAINHGARVLLAGRLDRCPEQRGYLCPRSSTCQRRHNSRFVRRRSGRSKREIARWDCA